MAHFKLIFSRLMNIAVRISLICLVFSAKVSLGQVVNIEQSRMHLDSLGWSGVIQGNFQMQKYQNLFLATSARTTVFKKNKNDYWMFLGETGFSVAQEVQFNNMSLFHARYNRSTAIEWLKWEAFTQMQYNRLLGLDRRNLLGSGLRFKLYEKDNSRYYLGSSVMWDYEKVNRGEESVLYGRSSFYFSFTHKVPGKWSLVSTTYYQPLVNRLNDVRVAGQHAFTTPVGKHLGVRIELNHYYDSRPPVGIIKSTFNSQIGLIWEL